MAKKFDVISEDYDLYFVTLATRETVKISVPHSENMNNEFVKFINTEDDFATVTVDVGLHSKLELKKSDVKEIKFYKTMKKAVRMRILHSDGIVTVAYLN